MKPRTTYLAIIGMLCLGAISPQPASAQEDSACRAGSHTTSRCPCSSPTQAGCPNGLGMAKVIDLFAAEGIAIAWSPSQSPVLIIDYRQDYGGEGVRTDPALRVMGAYDIIKQANGIRSAIR